MMERKFILPLLPLLAAIVAEAAPVSPDAARSEALDFIASHRQAFRQAPATSLELSLSYEASDEAANACYYIFNTPGGNGYMIMSADDRLPQVLGFSDNGSFDYDKAPDNMKWWLGEYRRQIAAFLEADPAMPPIRQQRVRREDYAPVEPLLKSQWNQTEPYNDLCPIDRNTGRRSVTGCVATAMAQVMRYHEWPVHPTGQHGGEIFDGTTLDWANMLDNYEEQAYNATQSNAVALLMRQCGMSVDMQYSSYESGAFSNDVQLALRTYFDYNPSMRMLWRDYYKMSDWNAIVYEEVSSDRPVYYSGRSDRGGHAFVCDGYMGSNYFHFNWGWGGYQDGYFLLNALNPETGGTGSYAGGYNTDQSIICGVQPAKGETKLQYLLLSTGDFYYRGDNTYDIRNSSMGADMVYNPLAYRQQVSVGLKVTDMADESKVSYSSQRIEGAFEPYYGFTEMQLALPTGLADGRYKVTPAMYTQYNEWVDVMVPYNCQRWVTLEVSGGKYELINEGPTAANGSHVIAGLPQFPEPFYGNAGKTARIIMTNTGEEDFATTMYLSLYNDDGSFDTSLDMPRKIFIPAESSIEVEFNSNDPLNPGSYTALISYQNSYELTDSRTVQVVDKEFPDYAGGDIEVEEVLPSFHNSSDPYGVTITVTNYGSAERTIGMVMDIVDAETLQRVAGLQSGDISFAPGESTTINFQPMALDVAPGRYLWMIKDASGKLLGLPQPLCVETGPVEAEGLTFMITSAKNKEAVIIASNFDDYSGDVVVPEELAGYRITGISDDSFTFADKLTSVTLPAGVSEIPPGSFYKASSLQRLTLQRAEPPMLWNEAFDPQAIPGIVLSGAPGAGNIYHSWDAWAEFAMSNWTIHVGDKCTIESGLATDPLTGTYYEPYYIGAAERLTFDISVPEGRAVSARYRIGNGAERTIETQRTLRLPALDGASGEVWLTDVDGSGVGTVASDGAPVDVYTTTGILVKRGATAEDIDMLPRGIYVAGGRKIVVAE